VVGHVSLGKITCLACLSRVMLTVTDCTRLYHKSFPPELHPKLPRNLGRQSMGLQILRKNQKKDRKAPRQMNYIKEKKKKNHPECILTNLQIPNSGVLSSNTQKQIPNLHGSGFDEDQAITNFLYPFLSDSSNLYVQYTILAGHRKGADPNEWFWRLFAEFHV
jgi:hypothetical protein